jgi:hypothetical protein
MISWSGLTHNATSSVSAKVVLHTAALGVVDMQAAFLAGWVNKFPG